MEVWLQPEAVEEMKRAKENGHSHAALQVRLDRQDDYFTIPATIWEEGD